MSSVRLQVGLRFAFHALVSGGFLVAYLTGDEDTYRMHQVAGYTVLVALSLRLLAAWLAWSSGPLALPKADLPALLAWFAGVLRLDRAVLLARSPIHPVLAVAVLSGVGAAAVTGAVTDWAMLGEDLHEWLGEAALVVVGAHIGVVLLGEAARRIARTGWAVGGGKPAASRGGQA